MDARIEDVLIWIMLICAAVFIFQWGRANRKKRFIKGDGKMENEERYLAIAKLLKHASEIIKEIATEKPLAPILSPSKVEAGAIVCPSEGERKEGAVLTVYGSHAVVSWGEAEDITLEFIWRLEVIKAAVPERGDCVYVHLEGQPHFMSTIKSIYTTTPQYCIEGRCYYREDFTITRKLCGNFQLGIQAKREREE